MLTYNILHATTYDECKNIGVKLTSPTKYCFADNLFKFNCDVYGHRIGQNHFNANVYYMFYNNRGVDDILALYNRSLNQYKNIQSYHLIQVLNDNKIQSQVVITTYMQKFFKNKFVYAFNAADNGSGWPLIIPEQYKSQCSYIEYPEYYTPTEITNDNIVFQNNILYLNDKPLNSNGYYQNEQDMYKVIGGVCEIHLPFNIINARVILDKYKQYKLNFINDNNQLDNHCKTCVIDHLNVLQNLKVINSDIIISTVVDSKLFDELITFKQTI